jgi:hypothetical protein
VRIKVGTLFNCSLDILTPRSSRCTELTKIWLYQVRIELTKLWLSIAP